MPREPPVTTAFFPRRTMPPTIRSENLAWQARPMSARQRVAVVGVGAIGGTLAALLYEAGHEVTLCVRTPFPELVAEFADRTIHANADILTEPAAAKPVDWVILASKAYDSEGAAGWLAHVAGSQTTIVVVQNGVDQVERIEPLAPQARIVPALAYIAAERV